MDAHDLHKKPGGSLLEKIAADPDMINRPLPGTAPSPAAPVDPVEAASNVVLLHPDEHFPAGAPSAHGHKLILLLIIAGAVMVVSGGGAAAYFSFRSVPAAVIASPSATPTPSAVPTPTPTATPEPTPTPLPTGSVPYGATPTPIPPATLKSSAVLSASDVGAPAAESSASNAQTVMVKNRSGMWLRSTPDSTNKSNIIAWVPNGAQVSVDSRGDFWWHGTYGGMSGYFAANYTK